MASGKRTVGPRAFDVMRRDYRAARDPEQPIRRRAARKDTLHFCRGNPKHPHDFEPVHKLPDFGFENIQRTHAVCRLCGIRVAMERRGELLYEDISHDRQLLRDYLHGEQSDVPVPLYAFDGAPRFKRLGLYSRENIFDWPVEKT